MNNLEKQKGLSLVEAMVTLIILGVSMTGFFYWLDSYMQTTKSNIMAQQITTFGKAMNKYLSDNYQSVAANASSGKAVLITADMLKNSEYLQSGFNSKIAMGQSVCGLVTQNVSGTLNGLVVTEGGDPVNSVDLGRVAGVIGA